MPRFAGAKPDSYYRRAKVAGLRARSAFKLLECDKVFAFLGRCERAVDLCAAPGSWSQVLARHVRRRSGSGAASVVAVDLQQMAPIDGVVALQGDITAAATASRVVAHFGGAPVDLVVCDGAPDVTGVHDIDVWTHSSLLAAAVNITTIMLRPGGHFVAKVFVTPPAATAMCGQLRRLFRHVTLFKPPSSRASSREAFLLGLHYQPPPAAPLAPPRAATSGMAAPRLSYVVDMGNVQYGAFDRHWADGRLVDGSSAEEAGVARARDGHTEHDVARRIGSEATGGVVDIVPYLVIGDLTPFHAAVEADDAVLAADGESRVEASHGWASWLMGAPEGDARWPAGVEAAAARYAAATLVMGEGTRPD